MTPPIPTTLVTYRPEPGRRDELLDDRGAVRTAWRGVVDAYERLGPSELEERRRRAERLLVAEGAGHTGQEDAADTTRPLALDPVPLLVTGADWAALAAGLVQRARLLDAVLSDLYGPATLLRSGTVPAEAVYGHRGYQRAAVGLRPAAGPRLTTYAADVVRHADGRLLVLRDHTDVPAGAGYAHLNRMVLTRLFPELYRDLRVQRLGGWFAGLRAALAGLAPPGHDNRRTVVLADGVTHPSFVEHAYLASYLGYNLVEGADLTVRGGRLWLRSLAGLEPIDVVLRGVEDAGADPLELLPGGSVGVPGLVEAARQGHVGLANTPGSGVAGSLALLPFLPATCWHLLGEPLRLASVPTLWLGDPEHRAWVLEHLDRMVLHDADPVAPRPSAFGARLSDTERATWIRAIDREPHRYVAQSVEVFATTPVLDGGVLSPGTALIRAHAANTDDGWRVLPGGLGLVADPGVPVLGQQPSRAKDVWVLADQPEQQLRLWRPAEPGVPQIDLRASLPSRSAEALFWAGRNAERAEAGCRVALAALHRFEHVPELAELAGGAWLDAAVTAIRAITGGQVPLPSAGSAGPAGLPPRSAEAVLRRELTDAAGTRPGAIGDSLAHLVGSARAVRGFLSTSTWQLLGPLDVERAALADTVARSPWFEVVDRLDRVILSLSALAGLAGESIVRGPGWRFLDLGKRVERALLVTALVDVTLVDDPDPRLRQPLYETVLVTLESLVAYRRRYRSDLALDAVCDLALGDDANPRSLAFQLDRIVEHLATLPPRRALDRQQRLAMAAATTVGTADWVALTHSMSGMHLELRALLLHVRQLLLDLADDLVATWFAHVGEAHPVAGWGA